MLISEFARAAELSTDTVRFYIRRGLLTPETNGKGGRNPYQVFTAEHVRSARIIRMAQSLGMSLKEISALTDEYRENGMTRERSIEVMSAQLARLETKMGELQGMASYIRAKLAWLEGGEKGSEPDFAAYGGDGLDGGCEPGTARPAQIRTASRRRRMNAP
jgi:DNA-binding transcriptional MerR regulator